VKLLLKYGGQVEEIAADVADFNGDGSEEGKTARKLAVISRKGPRAPATVEWVVDGENEEGKNMNSDEERRVVLDIGEEDWEWLRKVEIRKGDDELLKNGSGRELREE
jgi:hypothetical protein